MSSMISCPCHSGKSYESCCKPYLEGKRCENALVLMRSRYAAYALGNTDYIMQTSKQLSDQDEILAFSQMTSFDSLRIIDFVEGEEEAYVTFHASLKQGQEDVSFTERSHFVKEQNRWMYRDGTMVRHG